MFAFGHGLTYANFAYRDLQIIGGPTIRAKFTVTNTGTRPGTDVPQLYLTEAAGAKRVRLLGFDRVTLGPGESRTVTLAADPRLLARFDGARWRIAGGTYRVRLSRSAAEPVLAGFATLGARTFGE